MTGVEYPRVVWEFVAAINARDRDWLATLFADECRVDAHGFNAVGRSAVTAWTNAELVEPRLTVKVLSVQVERDATVLRAQAIDGGDAHDCHLRFRTSGRYIDSLTISR